MPTQKNSKIFLLNLAIPNRSCRWMRAIVDKVFTTAIDTKTPNKPFSVVYQSLWMGGYPLTHLKRIKELVMENLLKLHKKFNNWPRNLFPLKYTIRLHHLHLFEPLDVSLMRLRLITSAERYHWFSELQRKRFLEYFTDALIVELLKYGRVIGLDFAQPAQLLLDQVQLALVLEPRVGCVPL